MLTLHFGTRRPMTWHALCDTAKEFIKAQNTQDPHTPVVSPTEVEFTADQWHDLTQDAINEPHAVDRQVRTEALLSSTVLGMTITSKAAPVMTMTARR